MREGAQVDEEEEKRGNKRGQGGEEEKKGLCFNLSNAPLDIMLLCVDSVLRGKSLK